MQFLNYEPFKNDDWPEVTWPDMTDRVSYRNPPDLKILRGFLEFVISTFIAASMTRTENIKFDASLFSYSLCKMHELIYSILFLLMEY